MYLYGNHPPRIMDNECLELPEIIRLEDYGGDIIRYMEVIYAVFRKDFVDKQPAFEGRQLKLKKYPLVDGKECTFYHFTHDGDIETERLPNLRRMERIPFPCPMIENSNHPYLKVWKNRRGTKNRILIFHEAESYLVVLEDRVKYILPWTAYLVEFDNRKRRLLKEYAAYKNRNRQDKPGGLYSPLTPG